MPRLARVVAKGYPHHETQRSNYRQPVFEDDNDYGPYLDVKYLEWFKGYGKKMRIIIPPLTQPNEFIAFK